MPKVTDIAQQKKKERFNIFLDGQFAFGVSGFNLLKHNLKVGKVLKEEEIKKIISEDKSANLMEKSVKFLGFRPRTEKELKDYITKKIATFENVKFSQAAQSQQIEAIIKKLKHYKYINDREFASWYAKSRFRSSPRSKRLIAYELKQKGIAPNVLESIQNQSIDETKLAIKSIEKKVERLQKLQPAEYKKKFYQFLIARGFDWETIKEAFAFFNNKR